MSFNKHELSHYRGNVSATSDTEVLLDLLPYDFTLTQCCCSLVAGASEEHLFSRQTELDQRDPPGLFKESCDEGLVCFKSPNKRNNQIQL